MSNNLYTIAIIFISILSKWVLSGELSDKHDEFFVKMEKIEANIRNIWTDTYVPNYSMLPCYLTQEVAIKILRIGKSINFIKLCLEKLPRTNSSGSGSSSTSSKSSGGNVVAIRKSHRSMNKSKQLGVNAQIISDDNNDNNNDNNINNSNKDKDNVTSDINDSGDNNNNQIITSKRILTMSDLLDTIITDEVQRTIYSLSFGDESILHHIIYSLSHSIDRRLLHLMMSRFHVQQHLLALKKFMLLGNYRVRSSSSSSSSSSSNNNNNNDKKKKK
jgi:hypothetical protein